MRLIALKEEKFTTTIISYAHKAQRDDNDNYSCGVSYWPKFSKKGRNLKEIICEGMSIFGLIY